MKSAVIFGPNGLLGPIWSLCLQELGFELHGFGIENHYEGTILKESNYHHLDLRFASVDDLKELIIRISPKVILFNSGVDSRPGEGKPKLEDYDLDLWRETFEVNLFGAVKLLNAISIISNPPNRVIFVGSMYATSAPIPSLYSHFGIDGQQKNPAYSASKSALLAVVRQYSSVLAKRGVLVNSISPGAIENHQDEKFREKICQRIPISRLGEPSELNAALRFLLDESNTYLVGQNIVVDGGKSLW